MIPDHRRDHGDKIDVTTLSLAWWVIQIITDLLLKGMYGKSMTFAGVEWQDVAEIEKS